MKAKMILKMKKIKNVLLAGMLGLTMLTTPINTMTVSAATSTTYTASSKSEYLGNLQRYYGNLKEDYTINDYILTTMEKIYNHGYNTISALGEDNLSSMAHVYDVTVAELDDCIKNLVNRNGDSFLMLSNLTSVPTASLNQKVMIPLSLINMGSTQIYDIVITPNVSTEDKWPFVIEKANDPVYIQGIFGSTSLQDAISKRMDVGFNFKVKDDLVSGVYEVPFTACYATNGSEYVTKTLTTYVNIIGKDEEKSSTPRVIVTGFTTEPENVYAGDTFKLTINLQNTSNQKSVRNVLFELSASVSSATSSADSYEVFLPTSGSNSVYTNEIKPGETYQLVIEMEAKADLSQKPYQLNVGMNYYAEGSESAITNTSAVSIPVKQEAKVETGTAEILPASISVGEESNIMFDVYNTGKTTLYNVKVTFESDCISSGLSYLGNITAGETKNVDTTVYGTAQTYDVGDVKAIISYEDENGNVSTVEKDIELTVNEESYEEYGEYEYSDAIYDDYETTKSGPNKVVVIIIVIVVVAAIAAVVIINVIKLKKKKADIKALEEDDDEF